MDARMKDFNALLQSSWGSEKWILEGWNTITPEEQQHIEQRVNKLFAKGLPFELKHDKMLYLYVFSTMAQLEVLGIQLPLRFENEMKKPELKQRMRAQLVDEIFHAIVFTKIVFILSEPYSSPPPYNPYLEMISTFVREQDCLKVGMVVLNLVCEGVIEEIFKALYDSGIASKVFELILEDERRHVSEADLYAEIGLPDKDVLKEKLSALEQQIIIAYCSDPRYISAMSYLLGHQKVPVFLEAIDAKYTEQLKKIGMVPTEQWQIVFSMAPDIYHTFNIHTPGPEQVKRCTIELGMTPTEQLLMAQMDYPGDPSMVVQFNLDVTGFAFCDNQDSKTRLTEMMMQTVSKALQSLPSWRRFLSFKKLYQTEDSYVSVIEKLPGCDNHLVKISFKNAHELPVESLEAKIKRTLQLMTYCYNRRERLEREYPALKQHVDAQLYQEAHSLYPYPIPGNHHICLTNLGRYGYTQGSAPLLKQMGMHVVLFAIERKPIWNHTTQSFEARDVLPISISADSRLFDGLMAVPELFTNTFNELYQAKTNTPQSNLEKYESTDSSILDLVKQHFSQAVGTLHRLVGESETEHEQKLNKPANLKNIADNLLLDYLGFNVDELARREHFEEMIERMLNQNLELGYRALLTMQSTWMDYVGVEAVLNGTYKKLAHVKLNRLRKVRSVDYTQ